LGVTGVAGATVDVCSTGKGVAKVGSINVIAAAGAAPGETVLLGGGVSNDMAIFWIFS